MAATTTRAAARTIRAARAEAADGDEAVEATTRPKLAGINHVALEVTDIDAALDWYGRIFEFTLRGRIPGGAFVDMGDQFLAFMEVAEPSRDGARHFGLVVDDKEAARALLEEAGVEIVPGRRLDFFDPWGNRVEVVQYDQIQFTKTDAALRSLGVEPRKTDEALAELRKKGLA
jgi:catechol 2,3-dioxygenase-like lactoylglutathione lyase family enzyme